MHKEGLFCLVLYINLLSDTRVLILSYLQLVHVVLVHLEQQSMVGMFQQPLSYTEAELAVVHATR